MIEKLCKQEIMEFNPYEANQIDCDIKLDANENPFDLSKENKEKVINIIKNVDIIHRYPDSSSLNLRKIIANKHGVSFDNVIVGTGSDQIISVLADAFIDKSDFVVGPNPSFGMYKVTSKIHMAEYKDFKLEPENNYEYEREYIVKFTKNNNAKMLFLCSPNNPTGNVMSNEDIEYIVDSLKDTIVVIDEAYAEFSNTSFISKVLDYENAIILRTFSKAYGLAGLRCGYAIAQPKMCNILKRVLPPYNLNQLTQDIAGIVMEDEQNNKKRVDFIKSERNRVTEILKKIDNLKIYDSKANYYLIKVLDGRDLYDILLKHKILIRKYPNNDMLKNCYRITVGTKEENDKVLKCIAETFIQA